MKQKFVLVKFLKVHCYRDNVAGGLNGPETVTFQDPAINSLYTYLIAINDFEFQNNGADFFNSGSAIQILNQLQNYEDSMVGNTGNSSAAFYFFGCVDILTSMKLLYHVQNLYDETFLSDGNFTATTAPTGIFFNGDVQSEWITLKNSYC